MDACVYNRVTVVKAMLAFKPNLNLTSKKNWDALQYAADKKHDSCVKLILEAGYDLDPKVLEDGQTKLDYCIANNR